MKTEQEYYDEYRAQGKSRGQARNMANRRYMTDVIRDLRTNQPEKYAQLVQKTQELETVEAQKLNDQQEFERCQDNLRKQFRYRLAHSLMCCGVPLPKMNLNSTSVNCPDCGSPFIQEGLGGEFQCIMCGCCFRDVANPLEIDGCCGEQGTAPVVVSFRQWNVTPAGHLHGVGVGSGYVWKEVNFANKVPSSYNGNGLYSVRLDPNGLLTQAGSYVGNYCGLLALRGTVLEHDDGVLRSEYARILCIWVTLCYPGVFETVPMLYRNYPSVPIFVCTRRQVAEALFKVVAMQEFGG